MELMTLPRSITKPKPVTEFVGGYQRLIDMRTETAITSQIPDDRIVVVMPQEKSSRYGEMQLRNRRVEERYATLTNDQVIISLRDLCTRKIFITTHTCLPKTIRKNQQKN